MGRGKSRYTVAQKIAIYNEAYKRKGNVKGTARKYEVAPSNIRRWKLLQTEPQSAFKLKQRSGGTRRRNCEVFDYLEQFICERERPVTTALLSQEARRCFPEKLSTVSECALYQRIARWLSSKKILHC
mmetsp:Transcript_15537/g.41790  ORF Transcript_15537/g.41790 Transcript_15537/m.41790 type:complete len:128 (+) Transcript_15537:16-399(+)